jgi:acyl dehydratase
MTEFSGGNQLYLDDLQIGQRFTSRAYIVDEEQIKAFARQFDPQPFHLKTPVFWAWRRADGTLLRSPCAF